MSDATDGPNLSGTQIGKYEVGEALEDGSFGAVHRGLDPESGVEVVIKVCKVDDDGLRRRFLQEIETASEVDHPYFSKILDYGSTGGVPYLVEESPGGQTLRQVIRSKQTVSARDRLVALRGVALALGAAHARGVWHRDIKPANVALLGDGTIRVLDLGVSRLASTESLSQQGVSLGTAGYLPPEQMRGGDVDHRADIFSFGVLIYELMSYERPFSGTTLSALVYQILYKTPPPLTGVWAQCPEPLSDLVERCLAKQPEERYDSFDEVREILDGLIEGVDAGKWPAIERSLDAGVREIAAEDLDRSEVVPRSRIATTAQAVLSSGEDGEIVAMPVVPPPPEDAVSGEATRFIDMSKMGDATIPVGETVAVSPPPGAEEPEQKLTDDAEEIRELVEKGDLEAARRRLEQTIQQSEQTIQHGEQTIPVGEAEIRPVPPPAPTPPPAPSSPSAQTPPPAPAPSSASPPPHAAKASAGPPKWAIPAAIGAVVVVLVLWFFTRGGEETPPAEVVEHRAPAPPTPPIAPPPLGPLGELVISAGPWAEVTEITNSEGFLIELPSLPTTPLRMELAPGLYRVQMRRSISNGVLSCEAEVLRTETVLCTGAATEETEAPRALDYFKESGWWQ